MNENISWKSFKGPTKAMAKSPFSAEIRKKINFYYHVCRMFLKKAKFLLPHIKKKGAEKKKWREIIMTFMPIKLFRMCTRPTIIARNIYIEKVNPKPTSRMFREKKKTYVFPFSSVCVRLSCQLMFVWY